jgi:hypothetical protein
MKRVETFTSIITMTLGLSIFLASFSVSLNLEKKSNGTPAGWSDEINLSNSPSMQDKECAIAKNGNDVYVVWSHYWDINRNIVFSKSPDGGRTWSPIVTLYHTNIYGVTPDIAVSGTNVHVVWMDWNNSNGIYYRNSTNCGDTWNDIKRITPVGHDAGDPNIFVNYSNLHIIWHDKRDGSDGEIYYRRSLDRGITFDNGQGIDADRRITFSPSAISGIQMAGDGSNISIIWTDERNGNFDIYWMISKDNGVTWEDGLGTPNMDRRISNTIDDSVEPAISVSGSNIHISWVEEIWPGPIYKIYYRNSTDNGVTWNPVQLLVDSNKCNAPDIVAKNNLVQLVWHDWRDDGVTTEIYYMNSTDGGSTWGPQTRITYNNGNYSDEPKIAVDGNFKHIVWTERRDGNREIYYKRSPDFPPDISPPTHFNETPLPDSYKDAPGTNISVHVTDSSGVNTSTIQLWVNGSVVSHTLSPITDGYNVSWVSGGFGPGVVSCRIVAEDNLGNVLDYTWNFTVMAVREIQLQEGWNLISLPLEQIDTSIPNVLASINGQWEVVKYYDNMDQSDPWKTYRVGSSVNDLVGIDNTMGFWIYINQPNVNLTVRGSIPTYTTIPLYAGWNLVGYPTLTTETVGNALWGTGADRVEVFDPVLPFIKEVGATYVMKPGEGYWVHVPADTVWTVN